MFQVFEAMTKQTFDFSGIHIWALSTDAFARDFAGHFMQFQSDRELLSNGASRRSVPFIKSSSYSVWL